MQRPKFFFNMVNTLSVNKVKHKIKNKLYEKYIAITTNERYIKIIDI